MVQLTPLHCAGTAALCGMGARGAIGEGSGVDSTVLLDALPCKLVVVSPCPATAILPDMTNAVISATIATARTVALRAFQATWCFDCMFPSVFRRPNLAKIIGNAPGWCKDSSQGSPTNSKSKMTQRPWRSHMETDCDLQGPMVDGCATSRPAQAPTYPVTLSIVTREVAPLCQSCRPQWSGRRHPPCHRR